MPTESISPRTTVALVSCCGVLHSEGSSAECAGLTAVKVTAVTIASPYTTIVPAPTPSANAAQPVARA